MRKLLLIGAAIALGCPVAMALAQTTAPAAGATAPPPAASQNAPPAHPMAPGGMPGMMGERMHGGMMEHHPWMGPHPGMMGMAMMFHSKAAFFRFQKGHSSVTIKCADDESTQACVNAATTLLDRIRQSSGNQ